MNSSSHFDLLWRKLLTLTLTLVGVIVYGDGHNTGPSSSQSATQNSSPNPGNLAFHTDLFSGRFSYGVPLKVPPGRNGSEPKLTLNYNSGQGNSWVGVGWNLELGAIVRNTKNGVPVIFHTHSTPGAPSTAWQAPASPPAPHYDDGKGFVFRLNGSDGNLVKITAGPANGEYRAEIEGAFLRFVLSGNTWVVTDKAGTKYYFGENTDSRQSASGWETTVTQASTFAWHLDKIVTATGDTTLVTYQQDGGMPYLKTISYNANANPTALNATALVAFTWDDTPRSDKQISFASGYRITMVQRLRKVAMYATSNGTAALATGTPVRTYLLGYGTSPSTGKSRLQTVDEFGNLGESVDNQGNHAPTSTFAYYDFGSGGGQLKAYESWAGAVSSGVDNEPAGGGGVDLADMDGDGLPDRVQYPTTPSLASWTIYKGNTSVGFNTSGSSSAIFNNGGALGWNLVSGAYSRLFDINGDGLPDRVIDDPSYWSSGSADTASTSYSQWLVQLNQGALAFKPSPFDFWTNIRAVGGADHTLSKLPLAKTVGSFNYGFGTFLPGGYFHASTEVFGDFRAIQSQSVRLLDVNGDGIPDRVMLVPWTVLYDSSSGPYIPRTDPTHLILDQDALFDLIPSNPDASDPSGYYYDHYDDNSIYRRYGLWVQLGRMDKTFGGVEEWQWVKRTPHNLQLVTINPRNDPYQQLDSGHIRFLDVNGDGLPDRVRTRARSTMDVKPPGFSDTPIPGGNDATILQTSEWVSAGAQLKVAYNNGRGFEPEEDWPGFYVSGSDTFLSPEVSDDFKSAFVDINGDGLPDRIMADSTGAVYAQINSGGGLASRSPYGSLFRPYLVSGHGLGLIDSDGINNYSTLIDVDGDGIIDRLFGGHATDLATTSLYVQRGNADPDGKPDALKTVDNGIGGTVTVAYRPSTKFDNTITTGVNGLPFSTPVVYTITSNDGNGNAAVTKYDYAGGLWDAGRREFVGFYQVTVTDPHLVLNQDRRTRYFFHQGGGRTASEEYDDTGKFAKRGQPFRVDTIAVVAGTEKLVSSTRNQVVEATDAYGRHFAYVAKSIQMDTEWNAAYTQQSATRCKAVVRSYELASDGSLYKVSTSEQASGNLSVEIQYGEITGFTGANYTLLDSGSSWDTVAGDTVARKVTYVRGANPTYPNSDLWAFPSKVEWFAGSVAGSLLHDETYTYDGASGSPSKGLVVTLNKRICADPQYLVETYTYDAYGMRTDVLSPAGITTHVVYDMDHLFPVSSEANYTQPSGSRLVTLYNYDDKSGVLLVSVDPRLVKIQHVYDPLYRSIADYLAKMQMNTITQEDSTTLDGSSFIKISATTYNLGAPIAGTPVTLVSYVDRRTFNPNPDTTTQYAESTTYLDGFGRPVEEKVQAEPTVGASTQFRCRSSYTVYDLRGAVVFRSFPYFENTSKPTGAPPAIAFSTPPSFTTPSGTQLGTYNSYDILGRFAGVTPSVPLSGYSPSKGDKDVVIGPFTVNSPASASSVSYGEVTGAGAGDPWVVISTGRMATTEAEVDDSSKDISTKYYLDGLARTNSVKQLSPVTSTWITSTYAYDTLGRLQSLTDSKGNVIGYAYDELGHVVEMADPDLGMWKYQYDSAGRLRRQTDAKGNVTQMTYGDLVLGRVTQTTFTPATSTSVPNPAVESATTYYYDTFTGFPIGSGADGDPALTVFKGQLAGIMDQHGYEKYGYDFRNRQVTTLRYLNLTGKVYRTDLSFDDVDRVINVTYPAPLAGSQTYATYGYDAFGNLNTVKRMNGGFSTTLLTPYTRGDQDEFGRPLSITFGNTAVTDYSYFPKTKRMSSVRTYYGTTVYQHLVYGFDSLSNVRSINDNSSRSSTAYSSATVTGITYDNFERLTGLTRPQISGTAVTFGYDDLGNLIANGEAGGSTYSYDAPTGKSQPHAAKKVGGVVTYGYDANGNMIHRGTQTLQYDAGNHLVRVLTGTTIQAEFGYSATGARLWKKSPNPTMATPKVSVWIGSYYEEREGISIAHVMAGSRRVATIEESSSGTEKILYYHGDHLGSSSVMTISTLTGNPVTDLSDHMEYSAYGRQQWPTSGNPPDASVTHRFTGQVLDTETGLYYYGARYYDPQLGRFVQPDSVLPGLFDAQQWNRYTYTLNNPLKYNDPSGHMPAFLQDRLNAYYGRAQGVLDAGVGMTRGTIGMMGMAQPELRISGLTGFADRLVNSSAASMQDYLDSGAKAIGARNDNSAFIVNAFTWEVGTQVASLFVGGGEGGLLAGVEAKLSTLFRREGCFVAGTLVATENGLIEIEKIEVGARVWSRSMETDTWELRAVEATPVRQYAGDMILMEIAGVAIEATGNHPFWVVAGRNLSDRPQSDEVPLEAAFVVSGKWVEARRLEVGDTLVLLSGENATIESVSSREVNLPVFNLQIEGNHTYSVSQRGVLVHNNCAEAVQALVKEAPELLLDSNVVVSHGKQFVASGQNVVKVNISETEIANSVFPKGNLRGYPKAANQIPSVPGSRNVDLKINVRGLLSPKNDGNFADGVIGATAIERGSTLITQDKSLFNAVNAMGGTAVKP